MWKNLKFINFIKPLWRNLFGSISLEMIAPMIIQPMIILFITFTIPNSTFYISILLAGALVTSTCLAKYNLRSHFLYYWTVLAISYIIIVFEFIIVPLAEISPTENSILILFTFFALFFVYLTATQSNKFACNDNLGSTSNGNLSLNGKDVTGNCPACRIKMDPRNFHCSICQECIPKYDHHSYWLNCCIGDTNFHYYVAGIFFGVFALTYSSLLILTTVCSPYFVFQILLPEDCTDVCSNVETCACFVCGIYCMELAIILLFKVIYHSWLISRGFSVFEWKEQFKYRMDKVSPHSNGFKKNWIQFFKKFNKIHIEF